MAAPVGLKGQTETIFSCSTQDVAVCDGRNTDKAGWCLADESPLACASLSPAYTMTLLRPRGVSRLVE